MQRKKCSKCKQDKLLDDFYNSKNGLFGKSNYCKICHKEERVIREGLNKQKYRDMAMKSYWKNREKALVSSKRIYNKNKEKILIRHSEWRKKNKEYMSEYHKNWYSKNREKKLKKNSDWEKEEKKLNPLFKIKKNLRTRIYNAIKKNQKSDRTSILLGCSVDFFKIYIEAKFVEGMTWENYGSCWHIDHIKPCSSFDFSKEEEQRACFHYTNLQPLFAIDNMKKHNKY